MSAPTFLRPFLSYYGGKWKIAPRYPAPAHRTIVEPFAGGAGYSLRHYRREVILVERDPRIAGIWRYLIGASPSDVLALPLLDLEQSIDDAPPCDPDGRELIRAWLQGGARNGKNTFSTMAKNNLRLNPNTPAFWGAACRARIAEQVIHIKHWHVIEGSYADAPDVEATWFVDPPYNNAAGSVYRFNNSGIDFAALGAWCEGRAGQAIVCENVGADWLPFSPLLETANNWNGDTKRSGEAIWCSDHTDYLR